MTERFEPARFGTPPPVEPAGLDAGRRPTRRTALLALGTVAGGAALMAAYALGRAAIAWLHEQSEYRLAFEEIALDPEPPAYIKPGRLGLLRQVRRRARLPETVSVPGLDLADLAGAFRKHSPWVEDVDRIDRSYPNRLAVRLKYREPVAQLSDNGASIVLDRGAIVLPGEELERSAAGFLMPVAGIGGPFDPRAGVGLAAPDSAEERRALAATALAGFVRDRLAEGGPLPNGCRLVSVNFRKGSDQLYLWTNSELWILWAEAPGAEPPGAPTAAQKWDQLRDWLTRNPSHATAAHSGILVFTREGARLGRRAEG